MAQAGALVPALQSSPLSFFARGPKPSGLLGEPGRASLRLGPPGDPFAMKALLLALLRMHAHSGLRGPRLEGVGESHPQVRIQGRRSASASLQVTKPPLRTGGDASRARVA